jgi:hypothetical protein
MSVVIDEFEVVVEPPPPVPATEGGAESPGRPVQPPGRGLRPEDVRFVIERRDERAARLFAH